MGSQQQLAYVRRPSLQSTNGQANVTSPSRAFAHADTHYSPQKPNHLPPNQSFQPPPFIVNGYHHTTQSSTSARNCVPYSNSSQYSPNGYTLSQSIRNSPPQQGWSGRYIPPPTTTHIQLPNGPPPANSDSSANNTYDDGLHPLNRPITSHQKGRQTSSVHNAVSLPPLQYRTPTSSFDAKAPSSSATPQVNGFTTHNSAATQPIGPPSQSPIKQVSPPAARSPQPHNPLSSPLAQQPSFPADGPVRPGFSPVKQVSPQQHTVPPAHVAAEKATALPPMAKLAPSPMQGYPVNLLSPSTSLPDADDTPSAAPQAGRNGNTFL